MYTLQINFYERKIDFKKLHYTYNFYDFARQSFMKSATCHLKLTQFWWCDLDNCCC